MTSVKTLLKTAMFAVSALMLSQPVIAAEKAVGIRAGYATRNDCPLAGLSFQYSFSQHFRLAPSADYMFRHHGTDAFAFNINAQFPIALSANDAWRFYPLAGVGYCNWSHHGIEDAGSNKDVTEHTTRLGLNAGAGIEFMCTPTLKLSLEGKYNLMKSYSGGVFNLGIAYVF